MTTQSASVGADNLGPIRVALATYPARWREKYGDEVLSVLADVSQATASGRLPAGEIVTLALRGLTVRARTSPVFWGGFGIAALFVWSANFGGFSFGASGAWNDLFISSGSGLTLALPLLAAFAAVRGHGLNRNPAPTASERLGQMVRVVLPLLATAATGWLAAFAVLLIRTGVPPLPNGTWQILLAQVSMACGTIAIGYAVGTIAHPILAVPGLLAGVFCWFHTDTWPGNHALNWNNVTGFNLIAFPTGLGTTVVPQALLVVPLASALATGIAVAVVSFRFLRGRRFAASGAIAVVVIAGLVGSPALLHFVGQHQTLVRSSTDLVCKGNSPEICLWPEEEKVAGSVARSTYTAEYQRGIAAGLVLPTKLSSQAIGQRAVVMTAISPIYWADSFNVAQSEEFYALAVTDTSSCETRASSRQLAIATYATALTLAVPKSYALPVVGYAPLNAKKRIAYLGINTMAQARNVALAWNAGHC